MERWKGFDIDDRETIIHHVTSNERISFIDKDNALIFSKGVIYFKGTLGGDFAEEGRSLKMKIWVDYKAGAVRTTNGWKINKILVTYKDREMTFTKK